MRSPSAATVRMLLLAAVGTTLAMVVATVVQAQGFDDYPDLVADAPEEVQPPTEITWQGETFLGVAFDGFVTNLGGGPLHIEGNPQPSAFGQPGAIAQHILDGSGTSVLEFPLDTTGPNPAVQYEISDDHGHWHVMRVMEYSLWNEARTVQTTAAAKIGFCLFDIEQVAGSVPPVYDGGGDWCAWEDDPNGGPGATYLEMGVSSGWRDTYNRFISLQWVDVSDVAPGRYYLAALADPNGIIVEADETNNSHTWTDTLTVIPGYVATDVSARVGHSAPVSLVTDHFGTGLGVRTLVIASGPQRGALNVGVGSLFTTATVTYTPEPGYDGPDSFTFYAYDAGSNYPANRAAHTATVTLDVATPNLAPQLSDPGNMASDLGEPVTFDLEATDVDGDELTYSASGLPPGLAITPGTGRVSGTTTTAGVFRVTASVSDGAATDSVIFEWVVGPQPFADVDETHRFAGAIAWMAAERISLGCTETEFCPDDPVSRGQIASFFARAFDLTDGAGADRFDDDDGNVHEPNIDALATAGITVGCDPRAFCPVDAVTRAQFASLLVRALGLTDGAGADLFDDDNGSVHEPNIDVLATAAITQGCAERAFCPDLGLTRGQLAQLLYRAIGA